MGGGSSKEKAASKEIERQLKDTATREANKVKLLLLGAGESGKSTVFKQMKILYGAGLSSEEAQLITPVVHSNMLSLLKTVQDQVTAFGRHGDLAAQSEFQALQSLGEEDLLSPENGQQLKVLWKDPVFQEVWARRAEYQVVESTAAFFEDASIDRITAPGYIASKDDMLLTRIRTSGIVEEEYLIDDVTFCMYDVGGQRNERKKWIHCFEDVTAVIFVVGLSEYDQKLYEQADVNRMVEALTLFNDIVNNQFFANSSMMLFLNKKDLFMSKIQKVSIKDSFPEFDGADKDYEAGVEFFQAKFLSKCANKDKEIFAHVTCATDTGNVKVVFNHCKDAILRANLQDSGFSL